MPRHERRLVVGEPRLTDNQRVHNYRVLRNWTQAIAAEHHGVSERTWQRWERPGQFVPEWLLKQITTWARRSCPADMIHVSW